MEDEKKIESERTGYRVKIDGVVFEGVTDDQEIVINEKKIRMELMDVRKNVEKLIDGQWPSIVDLG